MQGLVVQAQKVAGGAARGSDLPQTPQRSIANFNGNKFNWMRIGIASVVRLSFACIGEMGYIFPLELLFSIENLCYFCVKTPAFEFKTSAL